MSEFPKGSVVYKYKTEDLLAKRAGFIWNDDSSSTNKLPDKLKVQCFYDLKLIEPTQYFVYDQNKWEIHLHCKACDRRTKVLLSEDEIKKINEQGMYQAFLGF